MSDNRASCGCPTYWVEDKGKPYGDCPYCEIDRLREALEILSSIWFYGDFKAETYNESKLQTIMEQINLWPTTEDEIIQRAGGGE